MNATHSFRLPRNPLLRMLAMLGLAALAIVLFFLSAVVWLTLIAVGLISMLLVRLFAPRRPPSSGPAQGDVIEGEYRIVSEDREPDSRP